MINRINSNPNIINVNQTSRATAARTTSALAASGSFADVYTSTKESGSVYANYTSTGSYVGGVRRGSAYAPAMVDLENPKAVERKLEEMTSDFSRKYYSGFFDEMDVKESFSYLYEWFSDEFGANFLEYEWQSYSMMRVPNESDVAKSTIAQKFNYMFLQTAPNESPEQCQQSIHEGFASYFGYGDMTPDERYAAILSEYNASGDRSYAATFKMLWLLENTGAVDYELVRDARSVLKDKIDYEYSRLHMTPEEIISQRYANEYYGFDTDAEILKMVDHIQEYRDTLLDYAEDGPWGRKDVQDFFKKLETDLGALGGIIGGVGK